MPLKISCCTEVVKIIPIIHQVSLAFFIIMDKIMRLATVIAVASFMLMVASSEASMMRPSLPQNQTPYACQKLSQRLARYGVKAQFYPIGILHENVAQGAVGYLRSPLVEKSYAVRTHDAPMIFIPYGTSELTSKNELTRFVQDMVVMPNLHPNSFVHIGDHCYVVAQKIIHKNERRK